jgi:predicted ester cyclase
MFQKFMVILTVVLLVTGVSVPVAAQDTCDEATIRANIDQVIERGFNQGDVTVIDEVTAEDYISHPDDGDRESFKADIERFRNAIPQGQATIEQVLVEGCDAFFMFHFHGVMENAMEIEGEEPIQPTGQNLDIHSHIYIRFNEQGQLAEEWDYLDYLSLLGQLGVFGAEEGAQPEGEATEEAITDETITTSGNEARNAENVRLAYEEAFNAGDMELMRSYFAPDFTSIDDDTTLDALIANLTSMRDAFGATITIHDSVAQGNYVASRVTMSGTFENELVFGEEAPIPPTGGPITLEISTVHTLDENGLITHELVLFDDLAFLTQVGLMGAPAEATQAAG